MDLADIQQVNILSTEKQAILDAITIMDEGGRIVAMTVAAPTDLRNPLVAGVTVPTRDITYPPQMVDAIKIAFDARLHAIEDELTNLGVTGMPQR